MLRESTSHRIVVGMFMIVAGGIVLAWPQQETKQGDWLGALAIAGACLCWAIDNNLTRKVSAADSFFIATSKGFTAGLVSTALALSMGTVVPSWTIVSYALLVGFIGYGASLVLFVMALRGLGTARTGAYFSTAPFIGAAIAIVVFQETTSVLFWVALILMIIGVVLHLTERHVHEHTHEPLSHSHEHIHDEHHQHEHDFSWDGKEPHSHHHEHEEQTHSHHHFPDIHHRHHHK